MGQSNFYHCFRNIRNLFRIGPGPSCSGVLIYIFCLTYRFSRLADDLIQSNLHTTTILSLKECFHSFQNEDILLISWQRHPFSCLLGEQNLSGSSASVCACLFFIRNLNRYTMMSSHFHTAPLLSGDSVFECMGTVIERVFIAHCAVRWQINPYAGQRRTWWVDTWDSPLVSSDQGCRARWESP